MQYGSSWYQVLAQRETVTVSKPVNQSFASSQQYVLFMAPQTLESEGYLQVVQCLPYLVVWTVSWLQ